MPDASHGTAFDLLAPRIADALERRPGRLVMVGLSGAQGSGKSTLAAALARHFGQQGIATALLSIDDLYLPRAERHRLAREIHPLFATRGVPGTHDIPLALDLLARLERGEAVRLPRFDKAQDDRMPEALWPESGPGVRLLILEGWCVAARPQPDALLARPVNALERNEDAAGTWRRHVNAAFAGPYQALFARIDLLVLLAAPDFAVVRRWRTQQEEALRATNGDAPGIMTDAEIARFVQFYERLTRHILDEMPGRAAITLQLAPDRSVRGIMLPQP